MSTQELYNYIRTYAARGCFISEIAIKLHISYQEANHLTYIYSRIS